MCDKRLVPVYSGYIDVGIGEDPRQIDKEIVCDAILLSVWAVADDAADTIKAGAASFINDGRQEVYWGFDNVAVHPLYPGDTTDFIPVTKAKDLFIRGNKQAAAAIRVYYSCFKEQPK